MSGWEDPALGTPELPLSGVDTAPGTAPDGVPGTAWALLVDQGPGDPFGVLVVVEVVEGRPPLAVHHVARSASLRALAECGWAPNGVPVSRSWGVAVPVAPGAPA